MASNNARTDTFICGNCDTPFHDLVTFLEHKRSTTCGVTVTYSETPAADQGNVTVLAEAPADGTEEAAVVETPAVLPTTTDTQPSIQIIKRKGRPKKSQIPVATRAAPALKTKSASIGKDGVFCCDACKQKFRRERHFKSHKCKTDSDIYMKPEDIPELEEGFDSRLKFPVDPVTGLVTIGAEPIPEERALELDEDQTEDYCPTSKEIQREEGEDGVDMMEADALESSPATSKRRNIVGLDADKKLAFLSQKRKVATYPIPQTLDDIPDIPVFPNETARHIFEKKEITVVDLSYTFNMYKTHMIEQTMNENAIAMLPRTTADISLYSCNTCEKVFKSLSHIRYHCLTHIDSKPFKCPECDFRSNSKGNIYSHMRKHTGQMYRCGTCDFQSVNKSHLLEHEATHSGIVHKCALCKKHYSTIKSLVNHVRNYHSKTEEGKAYYQQFVHTKEGPGAAMLFECHVCDRKFKKQSDRDRHLYVHNVRVEQTVYGCKLCQYETAKETQLDVHYIKHKYVYSCTECETQTLSVVNLLSHISSDHPSASQHDCIPPECIEKSFYLPKERYAVLEGSGALPGSVLASETSDIFTRLGYLRMTVELYEKFREEEGTHECGECGLWFLTEELCKEHNNVHKGSKPFACAYCDHRSHSKNSLKLHINAHHEDNLFKCNQCDFVSKSKMALVEHKSRHESLNCPICEQYVAGRKGLRNHLLGKHPEIDAESARKISGYGRRTDAMKSGKAFKCPYCDKTFTNNNTELQKHIGVHEGIKPFKCELCDYSCRTRSNLTSHMLRHTEQKPFPCSFCGKKYKSKTALRWHERSHANGRLFKCDKCNYEGNQKSHLVRHMETHNIIKRFACNHCYFSSNTVGYMRIHYTRCHPGITYTQQGATPYTGGEQSVSSSSALPTNVYKCVSCDYLFGNLSDMKRHLRHRHRIHMTDMRVVNGQEDLVTEIVPMENQDGITSDVQIMRFPLDGGMETAGHPGEDPIFIGEVDEQLNGSNIQLVGNMEVETNEDGLQTVVLDYPPSSSQVMTFTSVGETSSHIFVQAPPTEHVTKQGVSLLKSSHPNIVTLPPNVDNTAEDNSVSAEHNMETTENDG